MEAQLSKITALPQKDKVQELHPITLLQLALTLSRSQTAACLSLLSSTLASSTSLQHDLSLFLDTILHSDYPQIVARQTLSEYVDQLKNIKDRDTSKGVMAMSLPKMHARATTFEEQVSSSH